MPKLVMHLDEFTVTNKAAELWRNERHVSYSSSPSPYDEPLMKALIKSLVEAFNQAVQLAVITLPENDDGLAHLSVFHPVDGWMPLCKAGMWTMGNCVECASKVPK